MIDLPTQKDLATPHHRKAVGALVASIIIFGLVLTVYYLRPAREPQQIVETDPFAAQKANMNIANPKVTLTPEQTASQQKLMNVANPSVKLTPEQVEQQKKLMGI